MSVDIRIAIGGVINKFGDGLLSANAINLFKQLNYSTERSLSLPDQSYTSFKDAFVNDASAFNETKALVSQWQKVDLLFQLTKEEVLKQTSLFDTKKVDQTIIEAYLFFSIELSGNAYTRTHLSDITRQVNGLFRMPVMIVFKYGGLLTLSVINRRLNKINESTDVLEKVTLIKDINIAAPHRAHIEIFFDLSLDELKNQHGFTNFVELHKAWQKTLDTKTLNKKFFNELSNWYHWAQGYVSFPKQKELTDAQNKQLNLIRLITRIIFVWFLKEKGLVQDELFRAAFIKKQLKKFDTEGEATTNYYTAILQNLFFATLNQSMTLRKFAIDTDGFYKEDYSIKNTYRYADQFAISKDEVKKLFSNIPFLNGGLFDCLDKDHEETGKHEYIDGFSREPKKRAVVNDVLFFGAERKVDLSEAYGYKRKEDKCRGIIEIFYDYKFTVEENTPVEEEIALDPELLGRVFENLLAYYTPETQTTARKQTGSFYTPREIVEYMVDESLIAYLKSQLLTVNQAYIEFGKTQIDLFGNKARTGQLVFTEAILHSRWQGKEQALEEALKKRVHYNNEPHQFTEAETEQLIFAIDTCKILDPACGSGAFPMGILNKLVYLLRKLDHEDAAGNTRWRSLQKRKAEIALSNAMNEKDKQQRENKLIEISETFENNASDYGRKLYLIENCIYGVDIQPIAVQISKLRFFISLIVDQKEKQGADNRGIRPLPNLETKFVAANTLIGLDKPEGFNFRSSAIIAFENELKEIRHRHFETTIRREKIDFQKKDKAIRKKIGEEIKKEFAINQAAVEKQIALLQQQLELAANAKVREAEKLKFDKAKKDLQTRITKLEERLLDKSLVDETADRIASFDIYDQNKAATWFEPEWMFGKDLEDAFELVIANPPYVQIQKLLAEEKTDLEKQQFKTYARTGDIYQLFYEKGITMLKAKGHLCYITSNKWMRTDYGESTRKFFSEGLKTKVVIDFGMAQMFESATTYTNILLLERAKASSLIPMCRVKNDYNLAVPLTNYVKQNLVQVENPKQKSWITYDRTEYALIKRIEAQGVPLKEWDIQINRGILTGFNEAFIIDTETRDRLVAEDPKSDEIIKPILRGEDIKAYIPQWAGKWIIGTFPSLNIKIHKFPAVKRYLENFKKQLEPKPKTFSGSWQGRKSGSYEWFETQDSISYYQDFLKPKIIYPNMTKFMPFVYDKGSFFCNDKACIISGSSMEYLTLFLNSRLFKFTFKEYFPELLGETRELRKIFFETIPIKPAMDEKWYKEMLNKIIDAKGKKLPIVLLEEEVDNCLFDYYKLTASERLLVCGAIESPQALTNNLSLTESE